MAVVLSTSLTATASMGHPNGSFVTRKTKAWHVAQKLADIINAAGVSVAGRFGPDQSSVIHAPRFENVEQDLQDGCSLTAGVGTSDITWTVDDTSKLTGGRYFIGTPTSEERLHLLSVVSSTQINVERGFEASTPGA